MDDREIIIELNPTQSMGSGDPIFIPVRQVAGTTTVIADPSGGLIIPSLIEKAGPRASRRFIEFFTANIRNPHTRKAYGLAVGDFMSWCERAGIVELTSLEPVLVAAYVEQLQKRVSAPTVKQHLAAIRMLLDWLVTGGVLPFNPSSSVRGPKHIVRKGLTPVLTSTEARHLIDSIETDSLKGLRDRALIGVMVFSFARVGAVISMKVEDYYTEGRRAWFRLHEKGGKLHSVPTHHTAETYMDAYIEAATIQSDKKGPLFRSFNRHRELARKVMNANDVLRMIKYRSKRAGLPETTCCHTFRATGITAYLENGGTIEKAQAIAAHESPRTTKLYDRTCDTISLDEVERIRI